MVPSDLSRALAERYILERELGEGGMATVYLAVDRKHGREVAIKVLKPTLAAVLGPDRFLREIEIAARLTHPHILPLHDSGEAAGFLYYVMPYVAGESLRARLERAGELPISETMRVLRDLVDAIVYAHAQGVVHRDIKPDNVLLADRHALVTDFGVAKAVLGATGQRHLTETGMALGTPGYMAPEQAMGEPHVDARADIYAVGALTYEMLTGRPPFTGPTAQAILAAHMTATPEPIRNRRDTVPAPLAETVMRCLAREPDDRWQTAGELLAAVESLITAGTGMTPAGARVAARTRFTRGRIAAAAAVALALLLAVIFLPRADTGVVPAARRIAVVPFAPATDDTVLARMGRDLVVTVSASLDGVGEITTVDGSTMLAQAAGRTGPYSVRDAIALARTAGGASVLHGNLLRSGESVRFEGSLIATADETVLARVSAIGPLDDVGALSDSLAWGLLRQIWPTDRLPTRSPHGITTRSLSALRAFLEGEHAVVANSWRAAADAYARAIAADSTFWLAHVRYARALDWFLEPVPDAVRQAVEENRAALPERERALLETSDADNLEDRLRMLESVIARFPDHWLARFEYADRLVHVGPLIGYARVDAQLALEQALATNPGFIPAWDHLYWVALHRDSAAADGALRTMIRLRADSASLADDGLDIVQFYRLVAAIDRSPAERVQPMLDTVSRALQRSADRPQWLGVTVLPTRLDLPRAQIAISLALRGVRPATEAAWHQWFVAQAWMVRGAWDSALTALDRVAAQDRVTGAGLEPYAAAVFGAWLGAIEPAAAHARRDAALRVVQQAMASTAPVETGLPTMAARAEFPTDLRAYLAWLDGVLALGEGNLAGTAAASRSISSGSPDGGSAILRRSLDALMRGTRGDRGAAATALAAIEADRVTSWGDATARAEDLRFPYVHEVNRLQAARWFLAAGDTARAARILTWHENLNFMSPASALAYLERAHIEEGRGAPSLARVYYEQFLRLYDNPPRAHQRLRRDAEAALTRLAARME